MEKIGRPPYEAPRLIPLDTNATRILLRQTAIGLLMARMDELLGRPIESGGNFRLAKKTQRLLAPHLQPEETLKDHILRTQQRPAALANSLEFSESRRQTVYHWYRRLGINYQGWPMDKRKPVTAEKKQQRVMDKLRRAFAMDDPLEEIGRLTTISNMNVGGIEKKMRLKNLTIRRWLNILGLKERKIGFDYLLKNKIIESNWLTDRERFVLIKYYLEGMNCREIALQIKREDGREGHVTRSRVSQLKLRALKKAGWIINKSRKPLEVIKKPDIIEPPIKRDILYKLPNIRLLNHLLRAKIKTVASLTEMTEEEVLGIRQIGPEGLKKIIEFLAGIGEKLSCNP